jgi:hypothetical protein
VFLWGHRYPEPVVKIEIRHDVYLQCGFRSRKHHWCLLVPDSRRALLRPGLQSYFVSNDDEVMSATLLKATCRAIFCALIGCVGLQVIDVAYLNKRKEAQRVKNGKPAKIKDLSMAKHFEMMGQEAEAAHMGDNAFLDMTDQENDEFIYVY